MSLDTPALFARSTDLVTFGAAHKTATVAKRTGQPQTSMKLHPVATPSPSHSGVGLKLSICGTPQGNPPSCVSASEFSHVLSLIEVLFVKVTVF